MLCTTVPSLYIHCKSAPIAELSGVRVTAPALPDLWHQLFSPSPSFFNRIMWLGPSPLDVELLWVAMLILYIMCCNEADFSMVHHSLNSSCSLVRTVCLCGGASSRVLCYHLHQ